MGKATGIFLILAGIGTAALVLPAVDTDAERQLADVVHIATGATPQTNSERPAGAVAPIARTAKAADSLPTPALRPIRPGERPANVATATSDGTRQPVLVAPPQIVIRNAVAVPTRQTDEQARQSLTRDIQRELKRVGCYDGDVSGEWSPRTRQAMKAFIDRVNAALPVDEPDHILRTMVQGHPGHACGQACPAGQTATNQGRCLPTGIVAQAPTSAQQPKMALNESRTGRPTVPKPTWETTVAAAPPRDADPVNLEGRMAAGIAVPPAVTGATTVDLVPTSSTAVGIAAGSNKLAHVMMPGAIAAFGGKAIVTSALGTGPRTLNSVSKDFAAATPHHEAAAVTTGGVVNSRQEPAPKANERTNERPRPVKVYRAPAQEKFRFPPPSYLVGIRSPRYEAARPSSFSHIFERLAREVR